MKSNAKQGGTIMIRRLVNALFVLLVLGSAPLSRRDRRHDGRRARGRSHSCQRRKTILVRAGEYEISQALTVPDDAALVGEGEMIFDDSGLPTGFALAGKTVIRPLSRSSAMC